MTVTSAAVDMIMSLVIVHENKKLILRPLNIVHEGEFEENGKAWACLVDLIFVRTVSIPNLSLLPCLEVA